MMVAAYEFFAVLLIRLIIGYISKHKPKMSPYVISLSISLLLTIGKLIMNDEWTKKNSQRSFILI